MAINRRSIKMVMVITSVLFLSMACAMEQSVEEESKRAAEQVEAPEILPLLAQFIKEHNAFDCALVDAVDQNNVAGVKAALDAGAHADARNVHGHTVLTEAARDNYKEIACLLLERKAQPMASNKYGTTPLIWAICRGNSEMVAILLAHKADVNKSARNQKGYTPLMMACDAGRTETALVLMEHNADVNVVHEYTGSTPLMLATYNGDRDLVQKLLDNKALVGVKDKKGYTALKIAFDYGYNAIMQLLVAAGASAGSIKYHDFQVYQLSAPKQKTKESCRFVIANALSINECLKRGEYISSDRLHQYGPFFYDQIGEAVAQGYAELSTVRECMLVAKNYFKMDNIAQLFIHGPECLTVEQSDEQLAKYSFDENGLAPDNKTIHAMVDKIKSEDVGAVHFNCVIRWEGYTLLRPEKPGNHAVLVSLIKERHKEQPYIAYMDSCNVSLENAPEAQQLINMIAKSYGKRLTVESRAV